MITCHGGPTAGRRLGLCACAHRRHTSTASSDRSSRRSSKICTRCGAVFSSRNDLFRHLRGGCGALAVPGGQQQQGQEQQDERWPSWASEPRPWFRWELVHQSARSGARVGRLITPHGVVPTPTFVSVGTHGPLKAVGAAEAEAASSSTLDLVGRQQQEGVATASLQFCNTFHLLCHPGPEVVAQAGGLHGFTSHRP